MRRALLVVVTGVLLAVAVAACQPDEDGEGPATDPADTSTDDAAYPLTGLPVEGEDGLQRPVLAVKVDNHPNARPQSGLEDADVVLVELVEGATRFVALYHSTQAQQVGPVRSGRMVDAELLPAFDPVFAQSGAAGPVLQELERAAFDVIEEGETPGWERSPDRPAPHNLFISPGEVWEARQGTSPPDREIWEFDDEAPADGQDVTEFTVDYPGGSSRVTWSWDDGQGLWLRTQDGEPHQTDGAQVAADTVVVPTMDATGRQDKPFEPTGSGDLAVFRDGQRFDGTWEKNSPGDHYRWLGAGGDPLPLQPGQTWVELLPDSGSLTSEGGPEGGNGQ